MTTPGIGYPDYQAYANVRNTVTDSGLVSVPIAGLDLGTFLFTNYASMQVIAVCLGGSVTLKMTGKAASGIASVQPSLLVDMTANTTLNVVLPVLGPAVDFSMSNNSASGKQAEMIVNAIQYPVNGLISGIGPLLEGEQNVTVGAGLQHNFFPLNIAAGKAVLHYQEFTAGIASEIFISALDSNGNITHDIFSATGTALIVNQEIQLPLAPIQVGIVNQGAAPMVASWSLTIAGVS